jgi:gluconolactonase
MSHSHESHDYQEMHLHAEHPCCGKMTGQASPWTQRLRHTWLCWLLPVAGLLSLAWFLIRVIPKPSRALYPCQRVAMPLASGFVAWVIGVVGSVIAFRKAKGLLRQSRLPLAIACIAAMLVFGVIAVRNMPESQSAAAEQQSHGPLGQGKGIHPGRVVWVHDPDATNWTGPGDGHPWQDEHTNQAVCDSMISRAVRSLTGETTDTKAWDALFRYHNKIRGKGDVGYKPGEKITIKENFVGMIRTGRCVNPETYALESGWIDYMNTSPQLTAALLKQLTQTAGVKQSDIAVGDPLSRFAKEYYDLLHRQFPDVVYLDGQGTSGRTKAELSAVPIYWSNRPKDVQQDYLPKAYAEAEYFINFANLKAHSGAGVTLCAKNHYGSLFRAPPEKGYLDLHKSAFSKGSKEYRNLVDLMGHAHTGGKTLLYLLDGLYCGTHPTDRVPRKFASAPFNDDWTSSLFASQDPVAIDSVGFDFLLVDQPKAAGMAGTDDYLHEAALADNPPSGTFYDPDHAENKARLASLGTHEHWNNPNDRQYSRNLGKNEGIELVKASSDTAKPSSVVAPGAKAELLSSTFKFTEGPAADAKGNVFFTDQPNDRICEWSVDGKLTDFMKPCGRSNGMFFDKEGNLWTCADMNNELWKIDPQGKVTVVVKDYKGKKLNGPNDLWIAPNGAVYFTDPLYKRDYWTRDPAMQQDGQHVYYLAPGATEPVRVTNDLKQPNGIRGTPDGKLLYVADIGAGKTYRYKINADGTLTDKTLFCSMGSDGMTMDNEGNLYLTGRGVTVFNPEGKQIDHIDINKPWTANVCFGGKDRDTLFITASDSLYAVKTRVKGAY